MVSSGVRWIRPGDVAVLWPDHGAFKEGWDKRELRLIGVICPWWHSLVGILTEDGFVPAPGWAVVEREPLAKSWLDVTEGWSEVGTVVADNSDQGTSVGEKVFIGDMKKIEFVGMPESHILVWFNDASKKYLRSLEQVCPHSTPITA